MRVFVTGASGWIGSAAVEELLAAGHEVVGLARSDTSAASLGAKGAQVRRGDLDDLDSFRKGAAAADAVLHLANKHDFTNPAVSNQAERAAVQAIGDVLTGSGRPFLLASGVAGLAQGRVATESDRSPFHGLQSPRGGSENLALDFVDRGVNTVSVRFAPTVHGDGDHGFIATLVAIAREKGVAGYVGDGTNRWPAVHRSDAARITRLGLEKAPAGTLLHAVSEEGVPTREIAQAIGRGLGVPVTSIAPQDAHKHFGWIGRFFAMDILASSTRTQELLGWAPSGPSLIQDLDAGSYFRP
ncbi:SDR family oxidoreductase [Streptomyces sp. MBT62]|uniref:SDR family oxidoreductase n=1 Tax=Streptomyces sp. MBT62 TaxID=2800410 RepID=UPI00190C09C3|nr:SDR family oxidoreductase [Streptomyces sp. MBT62]MBK3567986.1 SDR family oxidoreductase [Streptomyces sp. MBT62]